MRDRGLLSTSNFTETKTMPERIININNGSYNVYEGNQINFSDASYTPEPYESYSTGSDVNEVYGEVIDVSGQTIKRPGDIYNPDVAAGLEIIRGWFK